MEEVEWSDTIFLFEKDGLKQQRGVDETSLVVSRLESVSVYIGDRSHGTYGHTSVWRRNLGKWIKPACQLHVTHTDTLQEKLEYSDRTYIERGKVRVTYVGATSSTKALEIRMDLSKIEALQVARALINAAERIEESENEMRKD